MNENLDNYISAYESQFKFYDENIWYLSWYADRICRVIRQQKIENVLSLGIGHRTVTEKIISELDASLRNYTVLEGSLDIIKEFERTHNIDGVQLVHTYFENYDSNVKYMGIEMGFVLEHVDDPKLIISKYKEMLTPGGSMFIAVPNARSLHRLIGYEAGLLDNMYRLSPQDLQLGHKRYFDYEAITKLVLEAGLQIRSVEGLMLKPVTGDQIKQLNFSNDIIKALFKIGVKYPEISNCIYVEATCP